VLQLIYADILEFHRRALKFFKRRSELPLHVLAGVLTCLTIFFFSAWKQLFLSTWKDFRTRFQGILDSLRRHKSLIEGQASLVEFEASQAAREVAENNFRQIEEAERKRQRIAVKEWLSPASSHLDQENATATRMEYPNTGQWLFNYEKMKSWCDPHASNIPLLWLNGIPGAGMVQLVINEESVLTDMFRQNNSCFSCYRRDEEAGCIPWFLLL
jgi:hypothetical protein